MNRAERRRSRTPAGFSLPELLVALGAGLLLLGVSLQGLLAEARGSQRLGERQRQLLQAGRALTLIQAEAARASRLSVGGLGGATAACGLAGRAVLLHLALPTGPITYTVGTAPSAIWRGAVLMRCGPAYGLEGEPSAGAAQNRVLLDGLRLAGTEAARLGPGVAQLTLQLERQRLRQVLVARD